MLRNSTRDASHGPTATGRRRHTQAAVAVALTTAGLAASLQNCVPSYVASAGADAAPDTGLGPKDAGKDATATPDAPADVIAADADAGSPADGGDAAPTFVPSPVAFAGSVTAPTGLSPQVHLIYAENDRRYWYFYIPGDAAEIKTRVSTDLQHWSDGTSIPLAATGGTSGANGGDLSVAYANVGNVDVVHVVLSELSKQNTFDLRLTITGAPFSGQLSAPVVSPLFTAGQGYNGSCDTDGTSIVIGSDGFVYIATGWHYSNAEQTTCDQNIYRSSAADTGGTWNASFLRSGYFVTQNITQGHQLVPLAGSSQVLGFFPDPYGNDTATALAFDQGVLGYDGDSGREPITQHLWDTTNTSASYDDWMICRLTDTDIHGIRHVTDTNNPSPFAFQELVYDGVAWQTEGAPASLHSTATTGMVLISDKNPAHGMLAFAIAADGSTINAAKWTPGASSGQGTWSAWTPFAGPLQRRWLSGSGCGSTTPTLFWTELTDAGAEIMAADVSGFLQ